MQRTRVTLLQCLLYAITALTAMSGIQASAATLCVNQNPKSGCPYTTIGAAVAAAAAGDTINVAPGRYAEDVHITQPVSLIGAGAQWTVINAKGLANGIFIDGINGAATITPGSNTLVNVTVSGFSVLNANFERNSGAQRVERDLVGQSGQQAMIAPSKSATGLCPGIPDFETNEGDDCGEGIHLLGTDHSTVVNNTVENNAGGILLSDDTGPTNANLIQENEVRDNVYDCGITMASHAPATVTGSLRAVGRVRQYRRQKRVEGNGTAGSGAGVGMFAPGPGNNLTYGNVVIGNSLTNNGDGGVAMHTHVPNPNIKLADNVVTGNYIAGNGPDTDVGTTDPTGISLLGTAAVTGTLITLNDIERELVDIAINNAAGGVVVAHLNNLGAQSYRRRQSRSRPGRCDRELVGLRQWSRRARLRHGVGRLMSPPRRS